MAERRYELSRSTHLLGIGLKNVRAERHLLVERAGDDDLLARPQLQDLVDDARQLSSRRRRRRARLALPAFPGGLEKAWSHLLQSVVVEGRVLLRVLLLHRAKAVVGGIIGRRLPPDLVLFSSLLSLDGHGVEDRRGAQEIIEFARTAFSNERGGLSLDNPNVNEQSDVARDTYLPGRCASSPATTPSGASISI
jgi:hypothetical protein